MRWKPHELLSVVCALALTFAFPPSLVEAGDNYEAMDESGTIIIHELWPTEDSSLEWHLHEDGVVTNGSAGTIGFTDVKTELDKAFKAWTQKPFSPLEFDYVASTPNSDSGCDFKNIITWSDLVASFGTTTIARAIVTAYVGEDISALNSTNRTIYCYDGNGSFYHHLPEDVYPDGTSLRQGSILDMDMTFNSVDFNYVTDFQDADDDGKPDGQDICATATHEIGHMLGFSHNSLAFTGNEPTTMRTKLTEDEHNNPTLIKNRRTLEPDDFTQLCRGYPGKGFYPGGSEPFTTGEITGRVTQPGGDPAGGVRVWAYPVLDPIDPLYGKNHPMYETFTVTDMDWELEEFDGDLQPGDYVLDGLQEGEYYLCIVAWDKGVPTWASDKTYLYNFTTMKGEGHTDFSTEFYDDAPSATTSPDLTSTQFYRKVEVTAGKETKNIDFVTGTQTTDFVLVMDRSGSMQLMSGTKTKLKALQDAAKIFIGYLDLFADPKHRLGLVQFEETPIPLTPIFDLQALTSSTVINAETAINTMNAGGMTNIIAGVDAGIDQLTNIANPHERQIMLLFTDGKHNRPVGSNLNVIHDMIVDNDITLYSIGFGDDISEDVLNWTAVDSGGLHVNEPELDELALTNHFLTIAASAVGEEVFVDPRYSLNAGEKVEEKVEVTPDDRSLTFVVHWARRDLDGYDVTITAPDDCPLTVGQPVTGFDFRLGDTYRIVRIPLPLSCQGSKKHAGTWTIEVKRDSNATVKDDMEILVFGDSRTGLFAGSSMSRYGPVVTARLVRNGRLLRGATISGEVYLPVPSTGLSEEQDKLGADFPLASLPSRPTRKPLPISLHDDGLHIDSKGEDGVFAVHVPVEEEGIYRVRLIAKYKGRQQIITRETWTSFYFDGTRIIGR